jgi:hypothetical protein
MESWGDKLAELQADVHGPVFTMDDHYEADAQYQHRR